MFVFHFFIIDLPHGFFGFSSVYLDIILLLLYMMTSNTDDAARLASHRSPPTSVHGLVPHLPPDDPTSASYIPRAARTIPTSTTVHSVFIKKLSYPLSTRPDELWIVERTLDGIETWKPVETFLENMHLTNDQTTLRTTANQWRRYYDVPIQSSSSSPTATAVPVLPHPEHSNVYVSQPYEAIPDQLHILQSMLGTLCPTPFSRNHHLFILATMEVYTTVFNHRQHYNVLYISLALPSLFNKYMVHWMRTIRARWICRTPVCNTPHHLWGIGKRTVTYRRFVPTY